jgi:hypothetical protein
MSNRANIAQDLSALRQDARGNNPRIVRDLRFRDVRVTHARSTR